MQIKNKAMLITYSDSLGRNMEELYQVMETYFEDVVGGIHLLPFFPSTGDRGFAPTDYTIVDSKLGSWEMVEKLGEKYYLMFDFMINHISRKSHFFQDFKKAHDSSKYRDMFIRVNEFFPPGRPS